MRRSKPNHSAPSKLPATALDAMAMAVSTVLIIGMVGSLVFFLVIAFYRGEYDARLMYILGLYSVATVLIARIAIESGRAYANAFSVPLAIVSLLAMLRFVKIEGGLEAWSWPVNVALLGIAWVLADRITFDCTWITERQRSVQQGLLQSLGLVRREQLLSTPQALPAKSASSALDIEHGSQLRGKTHKQRRHNPGVWVLYFALFAIPLFGVGELAIPAEHRSGAFYCLFAYLACALSLLVVTSLVGLRRYLRQRGVAMSTEMSLQWISFGVGGIALVLVLCLLLPLPGRKWGLAEVPASFMQPEGLKPSRWGWGGEATDSAPTAQANAPTAENAKAEDSAATSPRARENNSAVNKSAGDHSSENQTADNETSDKQTSANSTADSPPANKQQANNQPVENPQRDDQSASDQPGNSDRAQQRPGQQPSERSDAPQPNQAPQPARNDAQQPSESGAEPGEPTTADQPTSVPPQSSTPSAGAWLQSFGSLGELFKWLTIAVLAAIVIIYVVAYPGELVKLWRDFWQWWTALFGRNAPMSAAAVATAPAASEVRLRPFHSYANPFATQLSGWQAAQVIEHTFAALEAWGAERGWPRQSQQTSAEFARQLSLNCPQLGRHATSAAGMLDRLMFAGWEPRIDEIQSLSPLWKSLTSLERNNGP